MLVGRDCGSCTQCHPSAQVPRLGRAAIAPAKPGQQAPVRGFALRAVEKTAEERGAARTNSFRRFADHRAEHKSALAASAHDDYRRRRGLAHDSVGGRSTSGTYSGTLRVTHVTGLSPRGGDGPRSGPSPAGSQLPWGRCGVVTSVDAVTVGGAMPARLWSRSCNRRSGRSDQVGNGAQRQPTSSSTAAFFSSTATGRLNARLRVESCATARGSEQQAS